MQTNLHEILMKRLNCDDECATICCGLIPELELLIGQQLTVHDLAEHEGFFFKRLIPHLTMKYGFKKEQFWFYSFLSNWRMWDLVITQDIINIFYRTHPQVKHTDLNEHEIQELAGNSEPDLVTTHNDATRWCFVPFARSVFQTACSLDLQKITLIHNLCIEQYRANIQLVKDDCGEIVHLPIVDCVELLYHTAFVNVKNGIENEKSNAQYTHIVKDFCGIRKPKTSKSCEERIKEIKYIKIMLQEDSDIKKLFAHSDYRISKVIEDEISDLRDMKKNMQKRETQANYSDGVLSVIVKQDANKKHEYNLTWSGRRGVDEGKLKFEPDEYPNYIFTKSQHIPQNFDFFCRAIGDKLPNRLRDLLPKHEGPVWFFSDDEVLLELATIKDITLALKNAVGRSFSSIGITNPVRHVLVKPLIISASTLCDQHHKQLPFAEKEVANLKRVFDTDACDFIETRDVLDGDKATIDAVRRRIAEGDYDVIHFSGHYCKTGVVLYDGIMELSQLEASIRMSKSNPIVFLNACSTVSNIEVPMSIIRGGAIAFVGCLWDIPDYVAVEQVIHFYEMIFASIALGEALKEIRKALRDEHQETTMWSMYHLVGDPTFCL